MGKKITGVVFYEGPSRIDGAPIVGIATFGTSNVKTGNLVQTWILRSDIHPIDALNAGDDVSICGDCPLRGRIAPASERTVPGKFGGDTANKGRSCYVLVQNAPLQIYNGYRKGNYPKLGEEHKRLMMGRGLRYGSYGDPVAIPMKFWNALAKYCTGKAEPGYTHQWKNKKFSNWSNRVMASTHSLAENEVGDVVLDHHGLHLGHALAVRNRCWGRMKFTARHRKQVDFRRIVRRVGLAMVVVIWPMVGSRLPLLLTAATANWSWSRKSWPKRK